MPTTKEHLDYTIREWSNEPFTEITRLIPEDLAVVYDIGANVGGFTTILKRLCSNAKYYCFEPLSSNYEELLLNVPYATCFKEAIYYGATSAKLVWRGSNCGAVFLEQVDSGEPRVGIGEETALIELEKLTIPKPTLIKLDVEGAETNIIEHSSLLKKTKYLIIEWHPDYIEPISFFNEHLPNHVVLCNLQNKQFLLCLKSA